MNNDEDFDNAPEKGIIEILIEELQRQTGVVISSRNLAVLKSNISKGDNPSEKPYIKHSPDSIHEPSIHGDLSFKLYGLINNSNDSNEAVEWTQTYGAVLNAFQRLNKHAFKKLKEKAEHDINRYVANVIGQSTQPYSLICTKTLKIQVHDKMEIYKTEPLIIVPGTWENPVYRTILEDWREHSVFAEMRKHGFWAEGWKDIEVISLGYFESLRPKGKKE
jgi:hypothetical protein